MKILCKILIALFAIHTGSHGAVIRPKRMCSYFEPTNILADSRNNPDPIDGYSLDSEEGYDYQDSPPAVQLLSNNSATDSETIVCERNENYCYTLWSFNGKQNVTFNKQGCWSISDSRSQCASSECITEYNPKTKDKFLFCCCSGDLCNSRVTWQVVETPNSTAPATDDVEHLNFAHLLMDPVIWMGLAIVFLFLLTLILIAILRQSGEESPKPETAPLAPAGPGYSSNLQNVDNLKLVSLLGQGKYGTVWKGIVNERSVAVKIFPGHNKQYFLNERDIYNIPMMEHKSLLSYFGCDERRTIDDRIEYMLVLSLAQLGCLQDWLLDNTSSYTTFCKMSTSIAQGLSHLHAVIRKGDRIKPSICHRDLNTRNILVKADLTCYICDFGFALKTFGPRYEYRGEMTLAETKSIMEVGTLRYMAPEVLEGAVNLKDCESALKQIDIYSLGLVLWELATRCHDFYFDGHSNVPNYMAPYEAEVGKHPSYEQMQIIVSRQKMRPAFSSNWGCGSASRVIKETCEDCWDPDSEARLTSLCVEERLKELCREKKPSGQSESNYLSNLTADVRMKNPPPVCTNEGIIITPPNQIILTANSIAPYNHIAEESSYYSEKSQWTEDIKPLTKANSKAHLPKPVRKDKFPFKLPGKKLKRNKIEKTFQGWHGVRTMIQKKLFKRMKLENDDLANSLGDKSNPSSTPPTPKSTAIRPTNLDIIPNRYCPPQKRSTSKVPVEVAQIQKRAEENKIRLRSNNTKESAKLDKKIVNSRLSLQPLPISDFSSNTTIQSNYRPRIVVSKSANAMQQIPQQKDGRSIFENSTGNNLKRQRSLEVFREVFGSRHSTERLRDPSQRVKTPGDVPPSVRKSRASKTLSLYDDRMMGWDVGNTL